MHAMTKWYRANKHRPEVRTAWRRRTKKWETENREQHLAAARKHVANYRKRFPKKAARASEVSRKKRGARNRRFIDAYKVFFGCKRCGERDAIVLDLHHRDQTEKEFTVSKWLWRASLKTLAQELEKCDVFCANDHRRAHSATKFQISG